MLYIFEETNKYPLFIGDIQMLYPDATEDNLPAGFVEVTQVEKPEKNLTHYAKEIAPVKIDGVWTQQFEICEWTEEELAERDAHSEKRLEFIANTGEIRNPDKY